MLLGRQLPHTLKLAHVEGLPHCSNGMLHLAKKGSLSRSLSQKDVSAF